MKAFRGFLILSILLQISWVQAQVVSDFKLQLSPEDYSSWVELNSGESQNSSHLENMTFEKPFHTDFKNLEFHVRKKVDLRKKDPLNYSFAINLLDLNFKIQEVVTDHSFQMSEGGVDLNIRLKGSCHNLEGSLKNAVISLYGDFSIGSSESGQLTLKLSPTQLRAPAVDWWLGVESCTGLRGYQEKIIDEIQNQLLNHSFLQKILHKSLEEELQKNINALNSTIFKSHDFVLSEVLHLNVRPQQTKMLENQYLEISGNLWVQTDQNPYKKRVLFMAEKEQQPQFDQSRILLPKKLLDQVSRFVFHSQFLHKNFYTKDISGLKRLMKSRFSQFFIWPDLMKFRKRTHFLLQSTPLRAPLWSNLRSSDGILESEMAMKGSIKMFYPYQDQWKAYIDFKTIMNTTTYLKIHDQELKIGFMHSRVSFNDVWDPEYLALRNPNQRLSRRTLKEKMEEALDDQEWSYPLKAFEFSHYKLALESISYENSYLIFHLKDPKKLNSNSLSGTLNDSYDEYDYFSGMMDY